MWKVLLQLIIIRKRNLYSFKTLIGTAFQQMNIETLCCKGFQPFKPCNNSIIVLPFFAVTLYHSGFNAIIKLNLTSKNILPVSKSE